MPKSHHWQKNKGFPTNLKRLTVRQQTAFLQQCSQFELLSAIRSEHFEMKKKNIWYV